ncbi:MAG: GNAT family N-acetyltransferase [Variovorax sp.]
MAAIEFQTARLRLRQWRYADRAPFAAMNADLRVREFFYPTILARAESDHMVDICQAHIEQRGWSFWAVETLATHQFIGFVGLGVPSHALPFLPCVEIGWRLAQAHWGQGYATEAARAALRVGFEQLALDEIVAFTAAPNVRSSAVMAKLGMEPDGRFEHTAVPVGHALREHLLYRLSRERWLALSAQQGQ